MANFNPQVQPTQDPEWLRLSKPVEQPEANRSTAIGIKTAGDAAEEGLKGVDTVMKSHAEDVGYAMGQQESSDFLSALSTTQDSLLGKAPPEGVPPQVEAGLTSIQNNEGARSGGHISELEYRKNLYLKAKDLRSAYPGYRDYIDKGVEKATGITPNANQYITSLITQINKSTETAKEFQNKVMNKALEHIDAPGMDGFISARKRGIIDDDQFLTKIHEATAWKYTDELASARYRKADNENKYQAQAAKDRITEYVSGYTQKTLDGTLVNMGLTNERLTDAIAREASGKDTGISEDTWRQAAQFHLEQVRQMRAAIDNKFQTELGKDGRPIRVAAGNDYNATIEANMTYANNITQAIKDHDLGFMYNNKNAADAVVNNTKWKILQDKSVGGPISLIGAMKALGGENWIPTMFGAMLGDKDIGKALVSPESVKELLRNQALGGGFKGIKGINDAFDAASQEGRPIDKQIVVNGPAAALANPETPDQQKLNTIKYTFSQKEDDLLGKIDMDGKTLDGRDIKGRYAVFAEYAKPSVVKEVARLSNQYGDKYFTDYRNWMETSFTKHLFGEDLNSIREMQSFPGMKLKFTDNGTAPPRFEIDYVAKSSGFTKEQQGRLAVLHQTLTRVNGGIASISNVYKESGDSVAARLTTIMSSSARIDFGNDNRDVLQKMLNSVIASKKPKKEAE